MKKIVLACVLLVSSLNSSGQKQFVFSGVAEGVKAGDSIFLLEPFDYGSMHVHRVASCVAGEKGTFTLKYEGKSEQLLLVQSPHRVLSVMTEWNPGEITFTIPGPGPAPKEAQVTAPGLNQTLSQIREAGLRAADPAYRADAAYAHRALTSLDSLITIYADEKQTEFVRSYAHFHFGYKKIEAWSWLQDFHRVDSIELRMLESSPILYNQPEYFQFIYYMALNRMNIAAFSHMSGRTAGREPILALADEAKWYPRPWQRELIMLAGFKIVFQYSWYNSREQTLKALDSMLGSFGTHLHVVIGRNLLSRFG